MFDRIKAYCKLFYRIHVRKSVGTEMTVDFQFKKSGFLLSLLELIYITLTVILFPIYKKP